MSTPRIIIGNDGPGWSWPALIESNKQGDRVRIRGGYDGAGNIGYYDSKSQDSADKVVCEWTLGRDDILAAAIEPYPLSRDERIEAAIEDYRALSRSMLASINCRPSPMTPEVHALLFAIIDAGV